MKYFMLVVFSLLIADGFTQEGLDWVVPPIFDNVDDIRVNNKITENPSLIEVRKDKLWGLRTVDNEVILPIEFSSLYIYHEMEIIGAVKNNVQLYYDYEGYEVDKTEYKDLSDRQRGSYNMAQAEKVIEELKQQIDFVDYNIEDVPLKKNSGKITLTSKSSGDTLAQFYPKWNISVIADKILIIQQGKSIKAVIKDGKKINTFDGFKVVDIYDDKYIVLQKDQKLSLYNSRMEELYAPNDLRIRYVVGDYFTFGKKDEKVDLIHIPTKQKIASNLDMAYHVKNTDLILAFDGKQSFIIDYKTKAVRTKFGKLNGARGSTGIYRNMNRDSLYGLYDIIADKQLIPCEHKYAYLKQNLFFTSSEKRKRRNNKISFKTLYNLKGEIILSDSIKNIDVIGEDIIYLQMDKNHKKLVDHDGNIIKELIGSYQILPKYKRFLSTPKKGVLSKKYVPIADYIIGDESRAVDEILKDVTINYKNKIKYYIAKKKNKLGMIDKDGLIKLPFVFDEIEDYKSIAQNYRKVKYKGKYGFVKEPK